MTRSLRRLGVLLPLATCGSGFEPFQPLLDPVWGGRAIAVAANPTDSTRLFVVSETGGLFFTSGLPVFERVDSLPSFNVVDVDYAPGSDSVVVATASADFHVLNGPLWRSDDEGLTWTTTTSITCPDYPNPSAYALSFEPGSSNVYAGTDCGLARSPDNGVTWVIVPTLPKKPVFSVLAQAGGRVVCSGTAGLFHLDGPSTSWTAAVTAPPPSKQGALNAFAASPDDPTHLFFVDRTYDLYLSADGGANWALEDSTTTKNRPQFVDTSRGGATGVFFLWWGDGKEVFQRAYSDANITSGSPNIAPWIPKESDHTDPADLAFDDQGEPLLLVTDGGVHVWDDDTDTFVGIGAGPDGYNALQIPEVAGQSVLGDDPHVDLYFATQDNGIHALSWDGDVLDEVCCEGALLRASPTVDSDDDAVVTGRRAAPSSNFAAGAHFEELPSGKTFRPFPDADTDSDTEDVDGTPLFIAPGVYVQNTIDGDAILLTGPPPNRFRFTVGADPLSGSATWEDAFAIAEEVRGMPVVSGSEAFPVIYVPVARPGTTSTGEERIGLVRVEGDISSGTFTVVDRCTGPHLSASQCDGAGMGGMGTFDTAPHDYVVLGVSPDNPDYLLYPDIEDDEIKRSDDGGATWASEPELTAEITAAGGGSRFRIEEITALHTIAFDPSDPCHVLAGTGQNGIFRSIDRGVTWDAVPDTEQAGHISSFYFPPTGEVVVSSYGSGLWKLDVERDTDCLVEVPPIHFEEEDPVLIDPLTGIGTTFESFGDLVICPSCTFVVVSNGAIAQVVASGGRVSSVVLAGGTIHQIDSSESELPMSISNSYAASVTPRSGPPIRGLVIDRKNSLRGIIRSNSELPFQPERVPYLRVRTRNMAGGIPLVAGGGRIRVFGEGFATGKPVMLRIQGKPMAQGISVDKDGRFAVELPVTRLPAGIYQVTAEQREGKRLTMERRSLAVRHVDEEE